MTTLNSDYQDEEYSTSSESEAETNQHGLHQYPNPLPTPPREEEIPEPEDDNSGTSTPAEAPLGPTTMTARAYQREMLEESLKQNTIVTMDTGSGKTQVAILRIELELARSPKRVWFLAPTVTLAKQQEDVIRAQIPGVQSRLICGMHGVDAWSSRAIWEEILRNIRVIVSTFQILFDAVSHGFVRLDSLSLIVIDEAHNCVRNNAVSRLMRELYWRDKKAGRQVPHILGLTASPLMRANFDDLDLLEATLDSVCKTPNKHRDELIAKVNRPKMVTRRYGELPEIDLMAGATLSMANLQRVYRELDISRDPLILRLKADKTKRGRHELHEVMSTLNTPCRRQVRSFCTIAKVIFTDLGPWAADYYIRKVITQFLAGCSTPGDEAPEEFGADERSYLAEAFRKVHPSQPPATPTALSNKSQTLIDVLASHTEPSVGIVFVKERATVAVLKHLLSNHPLTVTRYRVGSMVGISSMPGRKRDFLDLSRKEDLDSLQDFRVGKTNLLVATNVLEEGIDVPACNLVICFDEPMTPKSFVQRRGRARMSASYLYLLIPELSTKSAETWQAFEEEMKRRYEDDMRDKKIYEELEARENPDYPVLEVESTGARLTIDDAKRHLEHFCATLSSRKFVVSTPYYTIRTLDGKPLDPTQPTLLKATVHLPASMDPSLRTFESLHAWYSQEYAYKDAAFQAYAKLREVGLVGDDLLPAKHTNSLPPIETREGVAEVNEMQNPWLDIAHQWQKEDATLFSRRVRFTNEDKSMSVEVDVVLPVPVPHMKPLTIYWSPTSAWTATMDYGMKQHQRGTTTTVSQEKDDTYALLSMAFGHRREWTNAEKQYPLRVISVCRNISIDDMGVREFDQETMQRLTEPHLVRETSNANHPFFYQGWLPEKPPAELVGRTYQPRSRRAELAELEFDAAPKDIPYVVVRSWPRKAGSFRPLVVDPNARVPGTGKPYPMIRPASAVKVDGVPAVLAHVGMLIPAFTQALEWHLVATDLRDGLLETVDIHDMSLVLTAMSATSARGPTDYERFEFLGDSILKFCSTVNVLAKKLHWPEGPLSHFRDNIIANSRLCRAAVEFGLDKYIIAKSFTLQKPVYVEDLLKITPDEQMKKTRELSTKTLADVVEALIGVCFFEGGTPKALEFMSLILPDVLRARNAPRDGPRDDKWKSIDVGRKILYENAPENISLPLTMAPVEGLIGYTFKKKALLIEALTHPSYNVPGVLSCLERLEFLGDAVLDHVVVTALFGVKCLMNSEMHLFKTALVNADILGFMAMEWAVEEERVEPEIVAGSWDDEEGESRKGRRKSDVEVHLRKTTVKQPLWSFMRHASGDMGVVQRATAKRYEAMRHEILVALETGTHYPWALLARLQAQKFYSDVFESVLGAVWVDSGSMDECRKVVERAGISPLMRRFLRDKVHLLHPKEELGMLAGKETVRYAIEAKEVGEDKDEREWVCKVLVGERTVVEMKGGVTREEARTRAAEMACLVLKGVKVDGGGDVEMDGA